MFKVKHPSGCVCHVGHQRSNKFHWNQLRKVTAAWLRMKDFRDDQFSSGIQFAVSVILQAQITHGNLMQKKGRHLKSYLFKFNRLKRTF